jgi:hypothetical protein
MHARIISRILNILFILYSLEVGIALLWLPWQSIWETNYVLYLYPQIRPIITNPFFKGAILGLGIDNILIGIREVVHIRSYSRGYFSR